MAYAAIREMGRLRFLAARLNARRPLPLLGALQMAALSQLLDARRPAATVVDQAVAAARRLPEALGNRFSAGFINATLRRFERERDALLAAAGSDPEATFNHPAWWIEAVRQAWPGEWQQVLTASLVQAPLTLRINPRFDYGAGAGAVADGASHAAASRYLDVAQLPHRAVGESALVLERAVPVDRIPGFAEGSFTVQDAGAQLAAALLAPRTGERILDACAAPGGKTTHLAAACRLPGAGHRPGSATHRADAGEPCPRTAAEPRALAAARRGAVVRTADARRRPETGGTASHSTASCWMRPAARRASSADIPTCRGIANVAIIATLAAQQRLLLQALWPLLRPGGTLLYVTCSIFPEEGEAVIAAFCSHQADCVRQSISTSWLDGQSTLYAIVANQHRRARARWILLRVTEQADFEPAFFPGGAGLRGAADLDAAGAVQWHDPSGAGTAGCIASGRPGPAFRRFRPLAHRDAAGRGQPRSRALLPDRGARRARPLVLVRRDTWSRRRSNGGCPIMR